MSLREHIRSDIRKNLEIINKNDNILDY